MERRHNSFLSLRGATQLGLDMVDLLVNARHTAEAALLNQLRQSAERRQGLVAASVNQGVELLAVTADRQYAAEQDLLARLYDFVEGSPATQLLQSSDPRPGVWRPAFESGGAIHLTAYAESGQIVVPLALRNHRKLSQTVTLQAVTLPTVEGADIPLDRLSIQPHELEIPGEASVTVSIVLMIDASFRAGQDYWAEIRIGGTDPRRLPLRLTVLSPESPASSGVLDMGDE